MEAVAAVATHWMDDKRAEVGERGESRRGRRDDREGEQGQKTGLMDSQGGKRGPLVPGGGEDFREDERTRQGVERIWTERRTKSVLLLPRFRRGAGNSLVGNG